MWLAGALWRVGHCAITRPALFTAGPRLGLPRPSGQQSWAYLEGLGPDLGPDLSPDLGEVCLPRCVSVEKGQLRGAGGIAGGGLCCCGSA